MERVIRKNKIYDRKLLNGRFAIDLRDPNHEAVFVAKMDLELTAIRDLMSQTLTGDTPGSNKFINPNVFPDQTFDTNKLSAKDKALYEACTNPK